MERITNCPNCGAVIDTYKCSFCGTRIVDFADLSPLNNDLLFIRLGEMIIPARCVTLKYTHEVDCVPEIEASFHAFPEIN